MLMVQAGLDRVAGMSYPCMWQLWTAPASCIRQAPLHLSLSALEWQSWQPGWHHPLLHGCHSRVYICPSFTCKSYLSPCAYWATGWLSDTGMVGAVVHMHSIFDLIDSGCVYLSENASVSHHWPNHLKLFCYAGKKIEPLALPLLYCSQASQSSSGKIDLPQRYPMPPKLLPSSPLVAVSIRGPLCVCKHRWRASACKEAAEEPWPQAGGTWDTSH